MNPQEVVINVIINSAGASLGAAELKNHFRSIEAEIKTLSQNTAKSFADIAKQNSFAFRNMAQDFSNSAKQAASSSTSSAKQSDKAWAEFARDAARYERERAKIARESDRAIEQSAKQSADARAREARRAANAFIASVKDMKNGAETSAKDTGISFKTLLGASFFGNLAANAVAAFISKLKELPGEAMKLAAETQNAFKGLTSVAKFKGIDQADAEAAVKNLRFVRGGIISIADASTALKNLLSTGFGLKEAVQIMERFSDASAFGKQSALDYGDAIRGASEGIKNQNSILVDNVGITKNLSVILKERGFQLEDLSDKVKGAAAREALYRGLLAESAAQVGDADRMMQGYTGTIAAQETAYDNLLRAVGEVLITNPAMIESSKIVKEQLDDTTASIKEQGTQSQKTARDMIQAWAMIKSNLIPFISFVQNLILTLSNALGMILTGAIGVALALAEGVSTVISKLLGGIVNTAITAYNKVAELGGIPGGGNIPLIPIPDQVHLGSETFFKGMRDAAKDMAAAAKGMVESANEGRRARERVSNSGGSRYADEGEFVSGRVPRSSAAEERLARAQALAEERGAGSKTSAGDAAKARRGAEDKEVIASMREAISELAQEYKARFGKDLPARFGQSGLHNKLGYDHRAAADISLDARTNEGRFVMEWLKENEINARASFGRETSKTTGKVISTGVHIHAGELSGRMGKGLARREGLVSAAATKEEQARAESPFYGMSPPEIAAILKKERDEAPIQIGEPQLAELPPELERTWANYYKEMNENEQALRDRRTDFADEYYAKQRNIATELGNVELDLAHLRKEAGDDQASEQRRLLSRKSEELDLGKQILSLQDELANSPYNESLRIQAAYLEDLISLRRQDEDAIIRQNRAQLQLADATTYHAAQANAKVSEYLASQKSLTETIADAKIGVISTTFDFIDRGLGKVTDKLGIVGDLIKDIAGSLLRLWLLPAFQKLFGLGGGPTAGPGGGGAPGLSSLLSFLPGFGGGGGGNATSGGGTIPAAAGAAFGLPGFGGNSNQFAGGSMSAFNPSSIGAGAMPGFLPSLSGSAAAQAQQTGSLQQIAAMAQGNVAPAAASGGGLASLAAGAPFIGAGLGAAIGAKFGRGSSTIASIMGAVGLGAVGLVAGAAIPSILAGTFAGLTALGAATFGIGAALAIAAFIIGKNAQRRKEEGIRNQALIDANSGLDQLLEGVKNGTMDGASALTAAAQIRADYLAKMGELKDGKTRNHALLTVRELDYRIDLIKKAGAAQTAAGEFDRKLIPTFGGGGNVFESSVIKVRPGETIVEPGGSSRVVPGVDRGYDSVYTSAPAGSQVFTSSQRANAQSFGGGGMVESSLRRNSGSHLRGAAPVLNATLLIVPDEPTADALIAQSSGTHVVKKVRAHVRASGRGDGLTLDLLREMQ